MGAKLANVANISFLNTTFILCFFTNHRCSVSLVVWIDLECKFMSPGCERGTACNLNILALHVAQPVFQKRT